MNFNRNKKISFKVNSEELKDFKKYARLHKLKLSEFIRKLLTLYKQTI